VPDKQLKVSTQGEGEALSKLLFESPESSSFCIECDAASRRRCLMFVVDNLPQAKFCRNCGSPLIEPVTAEIISFPTTNVPVNGALRRIEHDGERRHLRVPLCDVVRSSAISAGLDAEEWRETIAGFQRVAFTAIP
jgi:hypothetical protein